jgi:protein arginine kinase activator
MQCQLCDKQATVHLTEIKGGQKMERHLCEDCAQKEGITIKIKAQVPLSELLSNLAATEQETQDVAELRCPQCDITWAEFRKGGLLGCPHDYEVFERPLRLLIQRAQDGATTHAGRVPKNPGGAMSQQVKLMRLRQDLQLAVEAEDYEAAARIRDEISSLHVN